MPSEKPWRRPRTTHSGDNSTVKGIRRLPVSGCLVEIVFDLPPEILLQGDFDGIAKKIAKEVNSLISDREIISTKQKMRARAEQEIRSRVAAIHLYLKDDDREKYISQEKIFTIYMPDA